MKKIYPLAMVMAVGLTVVGCQAAEPAPAPGTDGPVTAEDLIAQGLIDEDGVLAEPATITLAAASRSAFALPLFLSVGHEAMAKRNLTVQVEILPSTESYPLMAVGRMDGNFSAPDVGLFNAIQGGSEIAIVAPQQRVLPESNDGLWCRTDVVDADGTFDWQQLRGQSIGSSQANRGTSMLGLVTELERQGIDVHDVEIEQMGVADQVAALQNGALMCSFIQEPMHVPVLQGNIAVKVFDPNTPGFPPGTVAFGQSILKDRPEVGMAYIAGLAEVYEDLQGNYLADATFRAELSRLLEQPETYLEQMTPGSYELPLAFPSNYVEAFQKAWRNWDDLLQYEVDLTQDQVIDPRFMAFANSVSGK